MTERVIFEGGHAVYLVPQGRKAMHSIRNVLVAWRDTRELARAIAEVSQFLSAATVVRIVTVDAEDMRGQEARVVDIANHLARLGVTVEVAASGANRGTIAKVLLDEARRMDADLIVMGAYGHSRFREWILGGVTKDMIAQSDVPILMAH